MFRTNPNPNPTLTLTLIQPLHPKYLPNACLNGDGLNQNTSHTKECGSTKREIAEINIQISLRSRNASEAQGVLKVGLCIGMEWRHKWRRLDVFTYFDKDLPDILRPSLDLCHS